jgi:hypothetical protein
LPGGGKLRLLSSTPIGLNKSAKAAKGLRSYAMKTNKGIEYCLIVEGAYLTETEAEHALRDPFIEDWVEQTGRFRIHNMGDIEVAPGVALGSLGVRLLDEHPLTEHKAKGVADALRRQDMFDEISVEPRDEEVMSDE